MAITNSTDGIYNNADGLRWKYGRAEATKGTAGEYNAFTSTHISEWELDYADLVAAIDSTTVFVLDYDTILPAGATIERVEWRTDVVWTSAGSFTLDVGTMKKGSTGIYDTIDDQDGIIAALPMSVMDTLGTVHWTVIGDSSPGVTTYAGTHLDVALPFDSVLIANWDTAAPTAGKGTIRIHWRQAFKAQ